MRYSLLKAELNHQLGNFQSRGYIDSFGVSQSYGLAFWSSKEASMPVSLHAKALCSSLQLLAWPPLTSCDRRWRKMMNQMHDKDLPGTDDDSVSGDRHIVRECDHSYIYFKVLKSVCLRTM